VSIRPEDQALTEMAHELGRTRWQVHLLTAQLRAVTAERDALRAQAAAATPPPPNPTEGETP